MKDQTYYVTVENGMFQLRQTRFKNDPCHPHDICATARNANELKGMYDLYLTGGINWDLIPQELRPN